MQSAGSMSPNEATNKIPSARFKGLCLHLARESFWSSYRLHTSDPLGHARTYSDIPLVVEPLALFAPVRITFFASDKTVSRPHRFQTRRFRVCERVAPCDFLQQQIFQTALLRRLVVPPRM